MLTGISREFCQATTEGMHTMVTIAKQVGSTVDPGDAAWNALRHRLGRNLILPDDAGYDDARQVYNAMIDRRPAAIARCANSADVAAVITFARQHDLPLTVRGGGHGVSGHAIADGSLTIDCAPMKSIEIDRERGVAVAGAGLRLGEFISAIEREGLVSPTGTANNTGLAGLTLGAGYGYLNGKYGLAIDNLVGAEVVTAASEIVHASEIEHPDLFWALRGGSGNFGVVTSFELRVYEVSQVLGGMIFHPFPEAGRVLRFVREVAASTPDELTVYALLATGPDGRQAVAVVPCWCGPVEEGETALAPIRAFGTPVADMVRWMPYSTLNSLADEGLPPGLRCYWKQNLMRELPDDAIDTIVDRFSQSPSARTAVVIDQVHGAARRVDPTATAFPHRNAPHGLVILSGWEDPADDAANIAWTRELAAATKPWSTGGAYVNEAWDEKASAAFGGNYARLAEIKAKYDPANLFRHNTNIAPAGRAGGE